MDEFQDRFKDQTRDFHRRSRANGVLAFRLARQMNMDGLHVENSGAALRMPLGLQLGGETVVCLRKGSEIGECGVAAADFVAGHDHYTIPFACERFEMNAVDAVSEHQLAAIWLALAARFISLSPPAPARQGSRWPLSVNSRGAPRTIAGFA
jgi:hypothetical protein